MTTLQKYSISIVLALILGGCAGSSKLTEIEPRIAVATPSPTSTQFHVRDSVVIRWVVRVRDSVTVKDSTVIHVATAEQQQFYIYSWWIKDSRGDSSYSTFDSQTENGNTDLYFAPVKVPYQDTTHVVTPPPVQQGAGTWTIVLIVFATAVLFVGLGIVIGKFSP